MKIDKVTSCKIANMGLCCAVLIVLNHINPRFPRRGLEWLWANAIAGAPFAVPYFFVVSGFLLAGHMQSKHWWSTEVCKRLRTLACPFFFWNIVMLAYHVFLLMGLNFCAHRNVMANVDLSSRRIASALGFDFFSQPEAGQLWYVRSLLIFVFISPFVKHYIGKWFLAILFAAYVFICPDTSVATGNWRMVFRWFFSLEGLFYFSVGVFLWYNPIRVQLSRLSAWSVFLAGFALFILGAQSTPNILCYSRVAGNMFTLVGAWMLMPANPWPRWLTSISFPIYILHPFLLSVAFQMAYHIPCMVFLRTTLVGWFLIALWAVGGSALFSLLLLKGGNKFGAFIFGGRGK
jgi:peptidoglycan/LPS O-acetylase OafA/YrhL